MYQKGIIYSIDSFAELSVFKNQDDAYVDDNVFLWR